MSQSPPTRTLPWLAPGEPFPPVDHAWGPQDPAPGLLAAGGMLDVPTLVAAYSQGIFPWFSEGQPILWWSTDPRMVLSTRDFRLHRSLRKTIQGLLREGRLEIRFDQNFEQVIQACAETPRAAQHGTWILPVMQQAYLALHAAGVAHCVETWIDGTLAGGLYGVNLGGMVFGESMFSRQSNASKIALAALVAFCRSHELPLIDCQQNTAHLASMGARTLARADFVQLLQQRLRQTAPAWQFEPVFWQKILDSGSIEP
jgi:leucyl/phenylalanyl-tRNA--protein transferase